MDKILKVLVTGGNGQVATEYSLSKPIETIDFLFLDKSALDITKPKNIESSIKAFEPDVIVNLAAYTNVEKAEKKDVDTAFNVNSIGAKNLAIACQARHIPLIHVSTDYVFDGTKDSPYNEVDLENPMNQYGRTKFLGEKWIQEMHDWYYILRVSWVYSNQSNNFFTTMLKLAQERSELHIVEDQYGSPTSAKEVCRAIDHILMKLDKKHTGIYHFSGLGKTTWKDFAAEIFSQTKISIKINGIHSSSWKSEVTRPQNTYMSSDKFSKTFNYVPAHWKNALREVVAERKIVPVKVGDIVKMNNKDHVIVATDWLKRIATITDTDDNDRKTVDIPFDILFL